MSYYGTVAEADTYHANRGNTKWAEAAEASPDQREGYLTRASDYVDSYRSRFAGRKTGGRAQEREWPRADATDASGESIPDDEIPYEIEYATYEAALLLASGATFSSDPSATAAVTRKRVKAGPVETETEYAESTKTGALSFASVDSVLATLLVAPYGSASVELLRV